MDNSSGVGVLDKAASVLSALEAGPATLAQLVAATHLARPTAHRLAVALEHHRLVARDMQGRFVLGPRLAGEYVGPHSVELFQNGFVRVASDPPERLVALIFNELRGGVIQRQGQSGWNRSTSKVSYLLVIVTERAIRLGDGQRQVE